jgi:hypothetical protein
MLSTDNIYPKSYLAQTSNSFHLITSSFGSKVFKFDPSSLTPTKVFDVPTVESNKPSPENANLLCAKYGGMDETESGILAPVLSNDVNADR